MPKPFSPFPYFGAKSWLVKKLYSEIIPNIKHKTFIDVFGGSGKVVINYPVYLKEKLQKENIKLIYNDLDKTLYAIFYSAIWNLDYKEALKKVNSSKTLAFIDPPYLSFEKDYRIGEKEIAIECLKFLQNNFCGSVIYTHNKVDIIVNLLRKYNYDIIEVKRPKRMLNTETKDYTIEVVGIRKPIDIPKQKHKSKNILDVLFSDIKIEKRKEITILDLFR